MQELAQALTKADTLSFEDPDVLPGIDREFIGYGLDKPDPQWPGGAKVAVSFVFNLPYGAERSLENGDEGGGAPTLFFPCAKLAD